MVGGVTMRKPHKAWWADKRNKDLATNEEGLKYAPDISNPKMHITEDEYKKIKYIQDKLLDLGLLGFDDRDDDENRVYKNYKSVEEYREDVRLAEDYLYSFKQLPPDLEARLIDEAKFQQEQDKRQD